MRNQKFLFPKSLFDLELWGGLNEKFQWCLDQSLSFKVGQTPQWSVAKICHCLGLEREFFLLTPYWSESTTASWIYYSIVMIRGTGLAPWEFEFPFSGSLTSTFLGEVHVVRQRLSRDTTPYGMTGVTCPLHMFSSARVDIHLMPSLLFILISYAMSKGPHFPYRNDLSDQPPGCAMDSCVSHSGHPARGCVPRAFSSALIRDE